MDTLQGFYQMPLKAKYLSRKSNTGGKYRPRSGNSSGVNKVRGGQGRGPRRRSYMTHIHER